MIITSKEKINIKTNYSRNAKKHAAVKDNNKDRAERNKLKDRTKNRKTTREESHNQLPLPAQQKE